jgi:hypothetical protein
LGEKRARGRLGKKETARVTSWALFWIRYVVIGIGFFLAFSRVFASPPDSAGMLTVVLWVAVVLGVVSFLSHVVFHREDARRLGWEGGNPNFQFETGFANLAFGLIALIVLIGDWGTRAACVALLGYGIYLLQAGILHVYRVATSTARSAGRLAATALTLILAAYLISFAARALIT